MFYFCKKFQGMKKKNLKTTALTRRNSTKGLKEIPYVLFLQNAEKGYGEKGRTSAMGAGGQADSPSQVRGDARTLRTIATRAAHVDVETPSVHALNGAQVSRQRCPPQEEAGEL